MFTMKNRLLASIFLVVFIDLLGFSIILPLLPYYAETFGASPFVIGLLTASYAAAQFLGAPLMGRLSDRYGRRPILILSIAGTVAGFILLALANNLWVLFASRLIDGLTGGNITVAQAYITDVTDRKNRARGLGMIGAAFGLGFIFGPAVGGLLSQFGYAVPALLAAGLSLLNLGLVAKWLPESLTPERRVAIAQTQRPSFSLNTLFKALSRPYVGPLLHIRFFFGLAFSMFQTVFALYGQARFGINASNTGFILAYVGVLSAFTQGFLVGRITNRIPEDRLVFWGIGLMAVSLLGWALAPSMVMLLIILIPTSLSGGILNTVISSTLTKSVAQTEIGGTLGLSSSLESLTRVIAPSLGGLMIERLGSAAPGLFGFAIMAILFSYAYRFILNSLPSERVDRQAEVVPVKID
jgi:DHA1 family tetracycline resistance protein-like MFS transporter